MNLSRSLFLLLGMLISCNAWAQSAQPIQVRAQELTVEHAAGTATFKGAVTVTRADLNLQSATLMVNYGKDGLKDFTARGNVVITRNGTVPETAQGDQAVFNPTANTLTLTGATVTLTRGPSTLKGDKLVYNLTTQQARVTNQGGPVQATFSPQ